MKTLFAFVLAGVLLAHGSAASAHTDLASSNPASGAIITTAPRKLELHFTEAVQLLKFSMTDSESSAVAVEFKPTAEKLNHFEIALPQLPEDSYTAHWSAMGADGHLVEKTFAFTIDTDAPASQGAAAAPAEPHAAHNH